MWQNSKYTNDDDDGGDGGVVDGGSGDDNDDYYDGGGGGDDNDDHDDDEYDDERDHHYHHTVLPTQRIIPTSGLTYWGIYGLRSQTILMMFKTTRSKVYTPQEKYAGVHMTMFCDEIQNI